MEKKKDDVKRLNVNLCYNESLSIKVIKHCLLID